jgi:hypothetical protein
MARRRTKSDAEPIKARFILNGKDWDDCTEEERDAFRSHATKIAFDVAMRPIEQRYGPANVAAALTAVLTVWKEEQVGHSPPFLIPLMEQGVPPFVVAHVVEKILEMADEKTADEPAPMEPARYSI